MKRKLTCTIDEVATAAHVPLLTLPLRWEKTVVPQLTKHVSVWTWLYRWLVQDHGYVDQGLHSDTFVGKTCFDVLYKAEKQRLHRVHQLRGEPLARALSWSDIGSGPLETIYSMTITGNGLCVITSIDDAAFSTLWEEKRQKQVNALRHRAHGASFVEWLTSQRGLEDGLGDLIEDILADTDFPRVDSYQILRRYLKNRNACDLALLRLAEGWRDYQRYRRACTKKTQRMQERNRLTNVPGSAGIYIVQLLTRENTVKIGRSSNVRTRLASLHAQYGPIRLIVLIPENRAIELATLERELHARFAAMRQYAGASSTELFVFTTRAQQQNLELLVQQYQAYSVERLLWTSPTGGRRQEKDLHQGHLWSLETKS